MLKVTKLKKKIRRQLYTFLEDICAFFTNNNLEKVESKKEMWQRFDISNERLLQKVLFKFKSHSTYHQPNKCFTTLKLNETIKRTVASVNLNTRF